VPGSRPGADQYLEWGADPVRLWERACPRHSRPIENYINQWQWPRPDGDAPQHTPPSRAPLFLEGWREATGCVAALPNFQ